MTAEFACVAAISWLLLLPGLVASAADGDRKQVIDRYGAIPIGFEENDGQIAGPAKYVARGRDYALLLAPNEADLVLAADVTEPNVLRMRLAGANAGVEVTGEDALPGRVSYLIGRDRSKWHSDVPTYRRVKYRAVYPGIDLVYYTSARRFEYDFGVAPGADPRAMHMTFGGSRRVAIDGDGSLVLDAGRTVRMRTPVAYQETRDGRREVPARYVLLGPTEVGFEVGSYDTRLPLVIDPVLVYSTFLGGSAPDYGLAIAADTAGNAYVVGVTLSLDFPTMNPMQPHNADGAVRPSGGDVFIAKLNASGTALVYSNSFDSGGVCASNVAVAGTPQS